MGIGFVHPVEEDTELEKVFFLQLDTPHIALYYLKSTQSYTSLSDQLWIGDTVTVYYAPINKGIDRFEGKLIQVEKRGELLLHFRGYQEKGIPIAVLGGVGLVATLAVLWIIWIPEQSKKQKYPVIKIP